MDIKTLTFIIVGLSFALYIGIAIWSKAASTKEFYVAGGGVHPVVNGMATAADWMSAASFISMAGLISFMGYDGGVYLMGWTGGYVLLALLLAPYLRKFGKFTVPDFIGDRYYSQTARTVAVICAIFVSFTYVAGQMRGVGVVFSRFLEVDIAHGVIVGMAIVFFYAVLGGMKGITYTQVAQYCVLITAYLVPAIFISILMTGNPIPQLGFGGKLAGSSVYLLDKLDGLSRELGFANYTSGTKSMIDVFCITAALMVGTAGLPHVIVRFFTVPKVRDARMSVGWALVFIALLYTTAPAVAAFARANMINTINGSDGKGTLYTSAPSWITNWQKTGLIKWQDKNDDGRMFYAKDDRNEMTIDRDIMVLANPEIARLPNWVVALVAAGGLAAALSTAAGLLLVISTSISHDLLKRNLLPDITDKQELLYARVSGRGHLYCRLSWHPSAGIRGAGGRLRLRACRLLVLPRDHPRDLQQEDEQGGGHRRHGGGHHVHRGLHHLFQVHQSRGEHAGPLAFWDISGGHRYPRNALELRRGLGGGSHDARPSRGGTGHGGEHPLPEGCRRGPRALTLPVHGVR